MPTFIPRRLDKFLSDSSALPLSRLRVALSDGRVLVKASHSVEVECQGNRLVFEDDEILLDGVELTPRAESKVFVLNKPTSVTSTTRDPKGKQDLSAWLNKLPEGIFPVGRLDRETTGALLLTDDGDLTATLLDPRHHTKKLYWLWLNETLNNDDSRLEHFRKGVSLPLGQLKAEQVAILHSDADSTELLVELQEGKNRQIRRMCSAVDFRLLHLHRRSIGSVDVNNLLLGATRQLTASDIAQLWNSAGGKQEFSRRKVLALDSHAQRAAAKGAAMMRLESWLESHRSDFI